MAGPSGAGKTTLAQAIGSETGAVVLDKDLVVAAGLRAGLSRHLASETAYEVIFGLARELLDQNLSVILDSPAVFTSIREQGETIARAGQAAYYIVECRLEDSSELERRLKNRTRRHEIQPLGLAGAFPDYSRPGTAPIDKPHLRLDTKLPVSQNVVRVLSRIGPEAPAALPS